MDQFAAMQVCFTENADYYDKQDEKADKEEGEGKEEGDAEQAAAAQ